MKNLDPESVNIYTTFLGGEFGRKAYIVFMAEAVELSQALQKPIQVIWTREEDTKVDFLPFCQLQSYESGFDRFHTIWKM